MKIMTEELIPEVFCDGWDKVDEPVNDANTDSNKGSIMADMAKMGMMEDVKPPHCISWYPEESAWATSLPRKVFRKNPNLKRFQQFLTEYTANGTLARQEAVSMLPPMFLDMQPSDVVVDLCAAPGSKTGQLLDTIMAVDRYKDLMKPETKRGLVVANDNNISRCFMLAHQMKRYGCPDLVITHHDAQKFPGQENSFDRVLADVPCSGDGTIRKAPDIWKKWNPTGGSSLHGIQVAIASKAIYLLKPGGTMVYSTCSLNPAENEAVVAELLRRFGDSIEVQDAHDKFPKLVRRNGLQHWFVPNLSVAPEKSEDDHGQKKFEYSFFSSHEDVPEGMRKRVSKSLFPPDKEGEKWIRDLLPRCMRFLPQDNDTGGFFVTVIKKTRPLSSNAAPTDANVIDGEAQTLAALDNDGSGDGNDIADEQAQEKERRRLEKEEKKNSYVRGVSRLVTDDPFLAIDDNSSILKFCQGEYGMSAEFVKSNLMIRTMPEDEKSSGADGATRPARKLYMLGPLAREICETASGHPDTAHLDNGTSGSYSKGKAFKSGANLPLSSSDNLYRVAHAGVRIFNKMNRENQKDAFRVTYEGIHVLLPFLTKRVFDVPLDFYKELLAQSPKADEHHAATFIRIADIQLQPLRKEMDNLEQGALVFTYQSDWPIVYWRGISVLAPLMAEEDMKPLRTMFHVCVKERKAIAHDPENNPEVERVDVIDEE